MRIFRLDLTVLEPIFFASREVGGLYLTEPLVGNYALAYALGWCQTPYRRTGGPAYPADLAGPAARGWYVTPAWFPPGLLSFQVQRFNAQTDAYYSRYAQNAITTERDLSARIDAVNFPQAGHLRLIARGSRAVCHVLDADGTLDRLPHVIRAGKFDSKVRVAWAEQDYRAETGAYTIEGLLNPLDLPPEAAATGFRLIAVHPTPLMRGAHLNGEYMRTADGATLPVGLAFLRSYEAGATG